MEVFTSGAKGCTYFDVEFTNDSAAITATPDPEDRVLKAVDIPASIGLDQPGTFKWEGADGDGNLYCRIKPQPDVGAAITTTNFRVRVYFG